MHLQRIRLLYAYRAHHDSHCVFISVTQHVLRDESDLTHVSDTATYSLFYFFCHRLSIQSSLHLHKRLYFLVCSELSVPIKFLQQWDNQLSPSFIAAV